MQTYTPDMPGDATRNLSQTMLNALYESLPGLIGGSADLASSNMTLLKKAGNFQKNTPAERNVRFGVREHAMGAICNGLALHLTGLIPYCATFFIFTDYMRNAMRISALAETGIIYVMTHDSIGLGEDGPTHQVGGVQWTVSRPTASLGRSHRDYLHVYCAFEWHAPMLAVLDNLPLASPLLCLIFSPLFLPVAY